MDVHEEEKILFHLLSPDEVEFVSLGLSFV